MAADHTDLQHETARRQYCLKSLFLLMTFVALVSGFAHYLGGALLLKQICFVCFTVFLFVFLVVGPLLLTEFLIFIVDSLFGLSTTSPMPGRRRVK